MRIISGTHKGRRIQPPTNMPYTRPTTDIAKEGLFNMLQNQLHFGGLSTLDLFGGTGCISYELASRGATNLTIVESDAKMFDFIKKTSDTLNLNLIIIKGEVFKYMQTCKQQYNFIFAGPPYSLGTINELPINIFKYNLLIPGGTFVLEHTPRNSYKAYSNYVSERNYGTTIFSFFVMPHS